MNNKELDKETLENLRDAAQNELDYEKEHGSDRHEPTDISYWIGFWSGKVDAYQFILDTYSRGKPKDEGSKMVEGKPTLEKDLSDAKIVIQTIDKYIGLLEELKVLSLSLKKDMIELEEEVKKAKEK